MNKRIKVLHTCREECPPKILENFVKLAIFMYFLIYTKGLFQLSGQKARDQIALPSPGPETSTPCFSFLYHSARLI